jgi:transposase
VARYLSVAQKAGQLHSEPPRVYRRVKHSKGEPMTKRSHTPAYPAELRERGVRLFRENRVHYSSDSAAYKAIAPKLGCSPDSLRVWCQQAERDDGQRAGLTTEEKDRIKELERENKELRQANEILKKASAYFAQAELDRPFKR